MDARLTISDELKHQESNKTKILKWLQAHPSACKDTSTGKLARQMAREFSTATSLATTIPLMVKAGAINRVGSNKKADYTINYLHRWVLPEVRANASERDKQHIKEVLEKVSEQTKLTDDGCLTTKIETEEKEVEQETTETQIMVPVTVETDTTNGTKNVNITITLNLSI